jgi:hypothetical protein
MILYSWRLLTNHQNKTTITFRKPNGLTAAMSAKHGFAKDTNDTAAAAIKPACEQAQCKQSGCVICRWKHVII